MPFNLQALLVTTFPALHSYFQCLVATTKNMVTIKTLRKEGILFTEYCKIGVCGLCTIHVHLLKLSSKIVPNNLS